MFSRFLFLEAQGTRIIISQPMSLTPIIGPTSVPRYFPREDLIFEGSFAFPDALVPRPDGTPLKEGQVRRFGGEALIGRPNPLKHIFHLRLEMKRRQDTPKGKILHNGQDREPGVEVTNPLILRKATPRRYKNL